MRASTGTGPNTAARSTKDGGKRIDNEEPNAVCSADADTVKRKSPGNTAMKASNTGGSKLMSRCVASRMAPRTGGARGQTACPHRRFPGAAGEHEEATAAAAQLRRWKR
eukprot:10755897-Alexandrium_andersonii.AAC.2